jgi:hypothetical protein
MVPSLPLLYPLPYLFANVSPLPATFTNYPGKNGSLPYLAEGYLHKCMLEHQPCHSREFQGTF